MTTTAPMIGAATWDGTPRPGDRHLLSASSVSDVLASYGLERWKRRGVSGWAVDHVDTLDTLIRTLGRDQAVATIAEAYRNAPSDGGTLPAGERGTFVHSRLEAWIDPGHEYVQPPAEHMGQLAPYFAQVDDAVKQLAPVAVDVEQVVFAPSDGVAGRFDNKVRLGALPDLGACLVDAKSADAIKKVYADSHGLQLTAYGYATHQATFEPRVGKGPGGARIYYVNDDELAACVAPTPVDSYAILQIAPTGWRLVQLLVSSTTHEYLRSVVNAWRWQHLVSAQVVGPELAGGAA